METIIGVLIAFIRDAIIAFIIMQCLWVALWALGMNKTMDGETPTEKKKRRSFFTAGTAMLTFLIYVAHTVTSTFLSQIESMRTEQAQAQTATGQALREFRIAIATMQTNQAPKAGVLRAGIVKALLDAESSEKDAAILFSLRGVNMGGPTSILNWNLSVILPSGQQFNFREVPREELVVQRVSVAISSEMNEEQKRAAAEIPSGTLAAIPESVTGFFDDNADYLPGTLLANPIQPGGGFRGWVAFKLTGLKEVIGNGTQFVVEMEQADGTVNKIPHVWFAAEGKRK